MSMLARFSLVPFLLLSAFTYADTYVGVAFGEGEGKLDEDTIYYYSGPITSKETKDNHISLYGGVDLDDKFALEGNYTDFGSYKAAVKGFGYLDTYTFDVSGITLKVVAKLPLNPKASLRASFGLISWQSDFKVCSNSFCFSDSTDDTDMTYGVGVNYKLNANSTIRVSYDHYDIDTEVSGLGKIDSLTVGAHYSF